MMGRSHYEPLLKKILIVLSIFFVGICITWTLLQEYQLKSVYQEKIEEYKAMVGGLAKAYPDSETLIVSNIFNRNEDNIAYGEKILNKYGYTDDIILAYDNSNHKNIYYVRGLIFILSIFLIGAIGIFILYKQVFSYLYKISYILGKYIDGDFCYDENLSEEGIVNIINNQLKTLGNNVDSNYQRLEQEKESSKALVTDISHQLKTPLSSLGMCNSILEDNDLSLDERQEFLNISKKNIKKLQSLIDCLVNISRLEAAMIKLKPKENNLKDTVIKAYNSSYLKAKNKNIDLELKNLIDFNLMYDEKWTEEAISNVIDNSIKYTPKGGKVVLSMEESLNYIKINISDNGVGIDKREFNNIFKRFYRGKEQAESGIEGSGVGLYLTRKILEEQGGSIVVKSKIMEGSKFTMLLPK